MTEAEAIAHFASIQLLTDAWDRPFPGYIMFDQIDRPIAMLERGDFPDIITRFWQEGGEWVWELHYVVPGPGPRRWYLALEAMVDDITREYHACRKACKASNQY